MLSFLFSDPLPVGYPRSRLDTARSGWKHRCAERAKGKNVVLVFYPRDETPTCRAQLCEFRDAWEQANAKNTVVFGVNPQKASSHAGFRKNNALPFPLIGR